MDVLPGAGVPIADAQEQLTLGVDVEIAALVGTGRRRADGCGWRQSQRGRDRV
jgi:hypothetical protein